MYSIWPSPSSVTTEPELITAAIFMTDYLRQKLGFELNYTCKFHRWLLNTDMQRDEIM